MKRLTRKAALLAVAIAAISCQRVKDIDRTQANRVDKSIFTGEWYYAATVVEAQYNQGLLFEGVMSEGDKIRWDIQENQLIAYRSYDYLVNQEQSNNGAGGGFEGTPVAAYAIISHFDVKREYNPATGDQDNVIVENTTDRPWFQRQYMRVDWSVNLVTDGWASIDYAVWLYPSTPYYTQEHEIDNPYAAEITQNNINVVGNYSMHTDQRTCRALQDYLCGKADVKVKMSFMRADPRDYEPLYYPDSAIVYDHNGAPVTDCDQNKDGVVEGDCTRIGVKMFARFGFFRSERVAYDNEYQWTRDGRVFLANRWNIWDQNYDTTGTLIPLANRKPRTITYYGNVEFPDDDDILSASADLMSQWDDALRSTVATLKNTQSKGLNLTSKDIPTMFQFATNSCNVDQVTAFAQSHGYMDDLNQYGIASVDRSNLKRACAVLESVSANKTGTDKFTWQKPGDLRWSSLAWHDTPLAGSGLLGYGPLVADPTTGETIAGYANIYGAYLEVYANIAAQYVALMNGDITSDAVSSGEFARDQERGIAGFGSMGAYAGHSVTKLQALDSRYSSFKTAMMGTTNAGQGDQVATAKGSVTGFAASNVQAYASALSNARLNKVIGSPLDRQYFNNDDIARGLLSETSTVPTAGAGMNPLPPNVDPTQDPTANDVSQALAQAQTNQELSDYGPAADPSLVSSPLAALRDLTQDEQEAHRKLMDGGCALEAAFADEGLAHIAQSLKGLPFDQVYARARKLIYESVAIHEVGHTLGLRHNFEGSFDALNYFPDFWQNYDPVSQTVKRFDSAGNSTQADAFMYSSIMDYSARAFDDNSGIGPYDRAAIAFGYGKLVQVWNSGVAPFDQTDMFYLNDYTQIPKILGGGLSCTTSTNCQADLLSAISHFNAYQAATDPATHNREYELYNRGLLSYLKNALTTEVPKVQNIQARHFIAFDTLYEAARAYYVDNDTTYFNYDEVPFMFCPDDYVFDANVTCQPYDKGASYTELVADRFERYSQYYAFQAFKRDRATFATRSTNLRRYASNLIRQYFGPMASVYRYYLYGNTGLGYDTGGQWTTLNDFPLGRDWQAASLDGLNDLVAVMEMPEPGDYCLDTTTPPGMYVPLASGATCATTQINVPAGTGRYYDTVWDAQYNYEPTRIGGFWDKYAAIASMTSNEGFFYRNLSDYLDSGAFSLSYWRGLHPELLAFFTSVFDPSFTAYSWRYDASQTSDVLKYVPVPLIDVYPGTQSPAPAPPVPTLPGIQASTSYSLRYYSLLLPMARYDSMFDYTEDFLNYSRVCLQGYSDCVDFGVPTVSYTDPITQYVYIAPLTVNPASPTTAAQNLGALAVQEAQAFANTYTAAAAALPLPSDPTYAAALQNLRVLEQGVTDRSSFLNIVRQLSDVFQK